MNRHADAQLDGKSDPVKKPKGDNAAEHAGSFDAHRRRHLCRRRTGHRLAEAHEFHEALLIEPLGHEGLVEEGDVSLWPAKRNKAHGQEGLGHLPQPLTSTQIL